MPPYLMVYVAELGGIVTNDLFALCDPLDRATNWSDTYHFRPEAKAKQADQVAGSVLAALAAGCRGGEFFENGFGHEDKGVPVLGYQLDISRCKVPTMELAIIFGM